MDEQHTPETTINFLFNRFCLIVSLYISWLIMCIGIIIISHIYLCYLHCWDFVYLCWTNIIKFSLVSFIVLFYLRLWLDWFFIFIFIFIFVNCYFIICIGICSLYMYMYVVMNIYVFFTLFFLIGIKSEIPQLWLRLRPWARSKTPGSVSARVA